MTPISDDLKIRNTISAVWHLYDTERAARGRLEAEVAALKKQLAQYAEQLDHAFAHKQQQATIAQQAAVIEQMREALENHSGNYKLTKAECKVINEVIAQQASPEILEARDQRIVEAIEKMAVALKYSEASSNTDRLINQGIGHVIAATKQGEWRKYL